VPEAAVVRRVKRTYRLLSVAADRRPTDHKVASGTTIGTLPIAGKVPRTRSPRSAGLCLHENTKAYGGAGDCPPRRGGFFLWRLKGRTDANRP
jgi:hypothetical protein